MTDVDGVYFEADPRVLICKIYSTGIYLKASAIIRHFRLDNHYIKGKPLKEAVATLSHLPLRLVEDVKTYLPIYR
jgi:hypothetical protein